jgi:hypothetical protein
LKVSKSNFGSSPNVSQVDRASEGGNALVYKRKRGGEGERNWNDVIERSRMNMGVKIYA